MSKLFIKPWLNYNIVFCDDSSIRTHLLSFFSSSYGYMQIFQGQIEDTHIVAKFDVVVVKVIMHKFS